MWEQAIRKDAIEKRVYIYLCLFAFANVLTPAGSNVFMGLTVAGLVHRLVRYHDDVREILQKQLTFWKIIGCLLLALLLSLPGALQPLLGLKFFFNDYIYRLTLPLAVLFCVHAKKRIVHIAFSCMVAMFVNEIYVIVYAVQTYPSFDRMYSLAGIMPWACLLVMSIPAAFVGAKYSATPRQRICCGLFGVISCVALIINSTRGAWLALVVSAVIIMVLALHDVKKILAAILLLGMVFGGVYQLVPAFHSRVVSIMNSQERSNIERRYLWQSAVKMFVDHPVTGVGLAQFKENYQKQYILPQATIRDLDHAHNNFFHFLAETGILGFGTLSALCGYLGYYAMSGWRRYHQAVYLILLSVVLGFFLHGLTEYTLRLALSSKTFWLGLGLCFQWCNLRFLDGDFCINNEKIL